MFFSNIKNLIYSNYTEHLSKGKYKVTETRILYHNLENKNILISELINSESNFI